ncbi:MAG: AEC family transporter [Promethearchaeota archaeon]
MIGAGVVLDRLFDLDLPTLSKLNFYVLVPALVFINTVNTELPPTQILNLLYFGIIYNLVIFVVAFGVFSISILKEKRTTLTLGTWLSNIGNYGIPLITFAFGEYVDFGTYIAILSIMIMLQCLLTFTLGIVYIQKGFKTFKEVLKDLIKIPIIYAILFAFILRGFNIQLIAQIEVPLNYLGDALVPIALITLGIQLSRSELKKDLVPISILCAIRLIIGPIIAFFILLIPFGFTGEINSVLILLCGTPVAVNVYLLSLEYKKNVELASQLIFWSTLLSSVTIPVLLLILI